MILIMRQLKVRAPIVRNVRSFIKFPFDKRYVLPPSIVFFEIVIVTLTC